MKRKREQIKEGKRKSEQIKEGEESLHVVVVRRSNDLLHLRLDGRSYGGDDASCGCNDDEIWWRRRQGLVVIRFSSDEERYEIWKRNLTRRTENTTR